MKTWLKGGLIGVAVLIILGVISLIINQIIKFNSLDFIFLIAYEPCAMITQCVGEGCMGCIFISLPISLILFFIIGAIIGLIIQKIKSK